MMLNAAEMITPPDYTSPVPRHVPVELYHFIFRHITNAVVLSKLCTISLAFRQEAQRVLYHTVRLRGHYHCILSWCKVIAENPRLASLVYSLDIPTTYRFTGTWSLSQTEDVHELQIVVKRAFSSLFRLRELYIRYSAGQAYLFPAMFEGHPFKLIVFEDGWWGHTLNDWRRFIYEQSELQHWCPGLGGPLEADMFPILTSAHIKLPLLRGLAPRPIRALAITEIFSPSILDTLSGSLEPFRPTLASLSMRLDEDFGSYPMIHTTSLLNILSNVAPNLRFLALETKTSLFLPCGKHETSDFLSALSYLTHLTTLILELLPYNYGEKQDELSVHVDPRPKSTADALRIATFLMTANRSLRRVAFEAKGTWANWRPSPCYIVYRRAGPGSESNSKGDVRAIFEGFNTLNRDSWWTFF